MASIRKRINSKGKVSYHVQIRISGHPPLTQTFDKKTDAENWAKKAESECPGRCKSEPPYRPNSEPGMEAAGAGLRAVDEFSLRV